MPIDYNNFSPNGEVTPTKTDDLCWWKMSGEELSNTITAVVGLLSDKQSRVDRDVDLARLYGNLSLMGLNGLTSSKMMSSRNPQRDRITFNVTQSALDTATAKIGKSRPRPLFLTERGNYKNQRKAKKLQTFIDGVFYENNAYRMGPTIFRDGGLWGDGITHVFNWHGRVKHERVLPLEILVDEVEGVYGEPRQMHRVKEVDRRVLIECFPNKKKMIDLCGPTDAETRGRGKNIADSIQVRESWHLPSAPESADGKRAITINNGTLEVFDWERDHFPFARFTWNDRPFGYWGQGGVEQIESIQIMANKVCWLIQRSMHLAGTFKILMEEGSKTVPSHFNNDIGTIIKYLGTKPEYILPPMVQPELYAWLTTLLQRAYQIFGISELSATSKKPEGLNSGKALREYNDIESDRFRIIGQNYEDYFMQLAKLDIEEMKDIAKEDPKYSVKVPGKNFLETIDWKEVSLKDDEYVMKIYPVSSLPSDPAGKLQMVQEYMQAGLMKPRTGRRLLDFPDTDQVEDLANAQEDYLNECLEKIVDATDEEVASGSCYTAPEPYDDLSLAVELGLQYYAKGKTSNLEEEKLDLIRQFIEDAKLKMTAASAPQGAMTPQADPQAPPISDMIANVPGVAA